MLQRTFAELAREPHVDTVALRSLSRESTAALVRALAPAGADDDAVARLSDEVWRMSGGSPLVVVEAMRAAAHEALSPDLAMLSLPERVRDIIRGQLERLAAPSRDLVALASVVGREFEFGLLLRVSGLGEEVAARGVEELIRRRVFHSVDEHLDFRHDRVREVAYGEILGPRRRRCTAAWPRRSRSSTPAIWSRTTSRSVFMPSRARCGARPSSISAARGRWRSIGSQTGGGGVLRARARCARAPPARSRHAGAGLRHSPGAAAGAEPAR